MKTFFRSTILGVAAIALLSAQTAAPRMGAGRRAMAQTRQRGAARQKLLAGYLGLTDAQQAQMKSIRDNSRLAAQPIRQQLRQNRADMRAAVQAGKPVDQIAAAQGALMGKLIAIRANTREQMRAVLTPAQVQKLKDLHKNG
jgi:Spy/CpxP family protein refolding chaperone